jgi:hypothetical protein
LEPSPEHPSSNKYGPLEYILIAGLGVLAIGFFYIVFGSDIRSWAADLFTREASPAGPQIEVVEAGRFVSTDEEEIIPVRNCGTNTEQEFEIERVRTVQHQLVLDETLDPEIADVLMPHLQRYYGFEDNEQVERRYLLRLSAGPDSGADYRVEWQNVWVEGEIVVTWPEDDQDRVPYQALTDLEFFFESSQEVPCAP